MRPRYSLVPDLVLLSQRPTSVRGPKHTLQGQDTGSTREVEGRAVEARAVEGTAFDIAFGELIKSFYP